MVTHQGEAVTLVGCFCTPALLGLPLPSIGLGFSSQLGEMHCRELGHLGFIVTLGKGMEGS